MHSKPPLTRKGLLDANSSGATIPKFLGYARAATGGRNVNAKLKPLRRGCAKKRFRETASRRKTALLLPLFRPLRSGGFGEARNNDNLGAAASFRAAPGPSPQCGLKSKGEITTTACATASSNACEFEPTAKQAVVAHTGFVARSGQWRALRATLSMLRS